MSNTRPVLDLCECGGKQVFETDTQTVVKESIDNGIMVKKVERFSNIDSLRKSHAEVKIAKDPTIV